jgi:non-specific serine/threonine protein kinase
VTGHLPVVLTSFVGRKHETAEVARILGSVRLVTLIGTAGIGKTRLALQVAATRIVDYPDGVRFVNLATVSDAALVAQSVAAALGVREPRVGNLSSVISSDRVLLLLDNCEHVVEGVAILAAELLRSCPGLTLLATSREPLRVSGEFAWSVPPLSLPTTEDLATPGGVHASDAVALLVERAQAVRADFRLDADTAPAIVRLCERLAGIPLAIELAAVRLRSLSLRAIVEMLAEQGRALDVLAEGTRDAPPRHQNLRTALAWSFDLLNPNEQRLFWRLAVFRGCGLGAIEAVCLTPAEGPGTRSIAIGALHIDPLQGVASLIDKSLLRMEQDEAGNPWYVMLEPVRDFARERLECSGEASALCRRHALECVKIVERIQQRSSYWPGLPSAEDRALLDHLEREHGNCREALGWCLAQGYAEPCFRLATGLWWFWAVRGYTTEGRNWLALILKRFPAREGHWRHTLLRARALEAAGRLAIFQGDLQTGRSLLEQSLELMDQLEDTVGLFSVLEGLGLVCHQLGDAEAARRFLERGLAMAITFGGLTRIADSLYNLGNLAHEEGDATQARAVLQQSALLCEQAGEPRSLALVLLALSRLDQDEAHFDEARQRTERALAMFEQCGDIRGAALALADLGSNACAAGNFTAAGQYLARSLLLARQIDEPASVALVLDSFAALASLLGKSVRALHLAGAAAALRARSQIELLPCPRRTLEAALEPARCGLGRAAQDAWRAGRALPLPEAIAEALALAEEPRMSSDSAGRHGLSRREMEVVVLVGRGLTNRQIAEALIIGEATVATHVLHIRTKLELSSRAHIAAWAGTRGLLDEPSAPYRQRCTEGG